MDILFWLYYLEYRLLFQSVSTLFADVMKTGPFIAHLVSACQKLKKFLHFLLVACNECKILQMSLLSDTPTQCQLSVDTVECATHSVRRHLAVTTNRT